MAQRSGGSAEVGATWVLIAAAGSGERLGIDRPKAFAILGERPLLAESLDRLERCELVDAIVVAAPPGWEEPSILLAEELAASKVVTCVAGGATRAESVAAALAEVDEQALVVIVHDAARPLVAEAVLERLLVPLPCRLKVVGELADDIQGHLNSVRITGLTSLSTLTWKAIPAAWWRRRCRRASRWRQ
jgi:CTP:molybdopterin cytidylyltransferase MocA